MTAVNFNYMSANSSSSLFRNGKVLTRRDVNGSDTGSEGINLTSYQMNLTDARNYTNTKPLTLHSNGFELLPKKSSDLKTDFFDSERVVKYYYPECAEIIKESTGANQVFMFDHNVRSASGKKTNAKLSGGQQVQGPAHVVHGDYTLTSAPDRIRQLSNPPGKNDTLKFVLGDSNTLLQKNLVDEILGNGRFAIINLWRNISLEPVEKNPIALCDAATVSTKDLVVFEIHYSDRVGENYFAKHNDNHKWYYYPEITNDEALLIKQWDSKGRFATTNGESADSNLTNQPSTFSFHSAFDNTNARAHAPDRWSIEVRSVVVY
ncbi:MAG: CmcJ/NvfI family oxidoreductase [Gammaproteobacteria bacterium]